MQKKTLLYIITKSDPMGGAQKYVQDLAQYIPSGEWNIIVATGGNGTLSHTLNENGVATRSISSFQRNIHIFKEIRAFFELYALYKEIKPDIVHLNSSKAGGLGAFVARIYNILHKKKEEYIHTIFTAHGWAFTEPRPRWQRMIIYLLHIATIFLADITIAVSKYTKQEIESPLPAFMSNPINKRVVVIENGIDPFQTLHPREARKEILEHTRLRGSVDLWSTQTLWMGSIAELHKNKGIDMAIEAIARCAPEFSKHNVSLVYFVIGAGEEKEAIERLIKRRKLESIVFLLGYIPDARTYLSAFDIYLLPSRKEGLPWTLLEAGCAGIPVISTDAGGTPEVLQGDDYGILTDKDPSALRDAILTLAQDTGARIEYGKKLQEHVQSHYSAERMLKRTLRLYWMLVE